MGPQHPFQKFVVVGVGSGSCLWTCKSRGCHPEARMSVWHQLEHWYSPASQSRTTPDMPPVGASSSKLAILHQILWCPAFQNFLEVFQGCQLVQSGNKNSKQLWFTCYVVTINTYLLSKWPILHQTTHQSTRAWISFQLCHPHSIGTWRTVGYCGRADLRDVVKAMIWHCGSTQPSQPQFAACMSFWWLFEVL